MRRLAVALTGCVLAVLITAAGVMAHGAIHLHGELQATRAHIETQRPAWDAMAALAVQLAVLEAQRDAVLER